MGKPLVRFCEGPGFNEWQKVRGIRHVVVACDEAFHESLTEHLINDHLKTSVYSKRMTCCLGFVVDPSFQHSIIPVIP